jgi:hypothetical protein
MYEFIIAHPIVVIVVVVFIGLMLFLSISQNLNPYQVVDALMTKAEFNFYRQLVHAIPANTFLFTKVRIADVIDVKPGIKGNARINHFRKIAAKHLDFVLVDSQMKILAAIELNDKSHERKDRKERDALVRSALKSAKVPFFEIPCTKQYNLTQLAGELRVIAGMSQFAAPSRPDALAHEATDKPDTASSEPAVSR